MKLQGLDLKPDSVVAKADQLLSFVRPPVDALIAMHGVVLSADSGARPTVRLVDPTSKDLVDQFSDNVSILTEMAQRMGVHGQCITLIAHAQRNRRSRQRRRKRDGKRGKCKFLVDVHECLLVG